MKVIKKRESNTLKLQIGRDYKVISFKISFIYSIFTIYNNKGISQFRNPQVERETYIFLVKKFRLDTTNMILQLLTIDNHGKSLQLPYAFQGVKWE